MAALGRRGTCQRDHPGLDLTGDDRRDRRRLPLPPDDGRPHVATPGLDETVWASAWLIDGRQPDWLGERALRRLRGRLREVSPADVRTRLGKVVTTSLFSAPWPVRQAVATSSRWKIAACPPSTRQLSSAGCATGSTQDSVSSAVG